MVFLSPIYISSQLALKRSKINRFSRLHGSSFTRRFVYISERNCALCMFALSHDVLLGLLHDRVNSFLVSNIYFIWTRAQKVKNKPFFEVAWIIIYAAFCRFLGTKLRSIYVCAMSRYVLRSCIKHGTRFSCLQYIFYLKSCSKGPILTIFLGCTDRHLHGVLSISRNETAFYICLRHVTMCC